MYFFHQQEAFFLVKAGTPTTETDQGKYLVISDDWSNLSGLFILWVRISTQQEVFYDMLLQLLIYLFVRNLLSKLHDHLTANQLEDLINSKRPFCALHPL